MTRFFAAIVAAALLAACDGGGGAASGARPPSPALYEIAGPTGATEGWLFGTIHSLPDEIQWRTDALDGVIQEARVLVVEVANLGSGDEIGASFNRLAQGSQSSHLRERIEPADRAALARLIEQSDTDERQFYHLDTWAAALALARSYGVGDPENGVDRAMLEEFSDRPVIELEGAVHQFTLFDRLPEAEQRDLLAAVVADSRTGKTQALARLEAWRAGDMAAMERETRQGLLADEELRKVLLVDRNLAWANRIDELVPSQPPMLVAVGAAHLPGEDGLVALLERRGYTVTRIQ
ncbi:TraB/GumN family protein [Parerythrobacter lacustris]|uniref:TraB/GumN family protein n=1 Tax=Parerythrobacter lacustris TaxID=2969984 RepID=A0ABT1XTC8_9SPHN|nr:TraB/GumN family protein [Parerythrobacter lacustris]MCR2833910.1 TraB/GumN family protein [Parerythrobacter lacustris]